MRQIIQYSSSRAPYMYMYSQNGMNELRAVEYDASLVSQTPMHSKTSIDACTASIIVKPTAKSLDIFTWLVAS